MNTNLIIKHVILHLDTNRKFKDIVAGLDFWG